MSVTEGYWVISSPFCLLALGVLKIGVIILPHYQFMIEVASGIDVRIDGYKVMGLQPSAMRLPIICVFIVCKHSWLYQDCRLLQQWFIRWSLQRIAPRFARYKPTARSESVMNQQHVYGMSGEIIRNRWMNDESNWWALCRRHPIVWLSENLYQQRERVCKRVCVTSLSIPHPALGFSRSFDRFGGYCCWRATKRKGWRIWLHMVMMVGFWAHGWQTNGFVSMLVQYDFLKVGSGRTTYLRAS